jgi:cell division protein FtsW (lipid II flippase)
MTAQDGCKGLPLQLQSDYTFTALSGWWGVQGATLVLGVYTAFALGLMRQAGMALKHQLQPIDLMQAPGAVRAHASAGWFLMGLLLLTQCWITVGGNLGWLPLTGLTWPLISFGRASLWLSTFLMVWWSCSVEASRA